MREELDKVLLKYIKAFEKKQGLEMHFAVCDDLLDVICFDYENFYTINEIVYDIDNDVKAGLIKEWSDYTLELSKNDRYINYESYIKGIR